MDLSYFFVLLCELRAVAMEKEDMFHLLLKKRQNTPQNHATPLSCTIKSRYDFQFNNKRTNQLKTKNKTKEK